MPSVTPVRIVILGGGFAGLEAALRLQRRFRDPRQVSLTLVNRENYFLFTPMLHEVAASDLDVTHIVNPVRKLLRHGVFFAGEVEEIDLPGRRVVVSHADGGHRHELPFDHLVIALGSVTNFFGLPGLAEHALTMKTLGDAIALRNRAIQLLEEADFECAVAARHDLLTFLVAGGGFAGVETAAALHDFVREALPFYPHLATSDVRVVLVHAGAVILPELSPKLGAYAQRQLAKRGVQILTETSVTGVSPRGVELSDGRAVPARTIVWTAGVSANPLVAGLPCRTERGRICVTDGLAVPQWPGVWALGDCALVPDPRTGGFHPPTAQHALRQGRLVARNVAAALEGRAPASFRFSTVGQLAAIGRRTGVASLLGFNFSGFVAWWLWRTIYLLKLPRLERKVRVALDWTLDLFFSKDLVQFQTVRGRAVSHVEAESARRVA
jgi:NADH dehydrogenase